jgi:hypothetical protein
VYGPGKAVLISAAFSCAGTIDGNSCFRIAAEPATCGVAIEVPESIV